MENQIKQKLNRELSNAQEKLPIKIVQFGGGNFMRGFTDYIIDKLNGKAELSICRQHPPAPFRKWKSRIIYTLFSQEESKKEKFMMKSR
jgi:tagaturonate reductase